MRISDTERQRTIEELRRHCAAGRIDIDEYADRIEKVMGAATLEDLDRALQDLPMLRIADPSRRDDHRSSGSLFDQTAIGSGSSESRGRRLVAAVTVLVTVAIVVAAALLLVAVSWGWALVLVGGWLVGLIQGNVMRRRRG